jgi:zinc protease
MNGPKIRPVILLWVLGLLTAFGGRGTAAQKKVLENGLTVVLERDESSPNTIFQILIKGGLRAEPPAKRGLSFLTTRLAIDIPDSGKAQQLISLATRASASAAGDYALISVACLSANLEPSLKVLSQIFRDPLFSGIRVDTIKEFMEHQGRVEEDDSVQLGHLTALRAFFGGSGYAGSIYGDKASLEAVKARDVSEFYKSYFVGSNIIMSFASDLPETTLLDLVRQLFSGLPSGHAAALPPVTASEPEQKSVQIERDTRQTFISLAYRLPGVSRRNFALASVLESLLGKGQGSRLWALRAEKKLAYNVNCRATLMQEAGIVEAFLETDATKKDMASEALRSVLADLYQNGTTEDELASAKNSAKTDFIRGIETKAGKAGTAAFFEASGLGLEFSSALLLEIDALTLDEVNSFIRKTLEPGTALEVAIGPGPQN